MKEGKDSVVLDSIGLLRTSEEYLGYYYLC